MIRSMTGFGRARGSIGAERMAEISVRSVNHRSLDLTVKLRETEGELEPLLRRVFARRVARGRVEVTLRVTRHGSTEQEITIDEGLLEALLERFAALSQKYPVVGLLTARDLLAIPQIFSVENGTGAFSAEDLGAFEKVAEEAAASLLAMREVEGKAVAGELTGRIEFLLERTARLSARREEITRSILANLRERLAALAPEVPLDSGRLEQEAALAADRSDITEELHRLRGHLEQFIELLSSSQDPVGKKLEFLSQEILRELNTLGSKGRDLQLIREVLEMKAETEKIREQVQNVE